jgi:hypothetical protein
VVDLGSVKISVFAVMGDLQAISGNRIKFEKAKIHSFEGNMTYFCVLNDGD